MILPDTKYIYDTINGDNVCKYNGEVMRPYIVYMRFVAAAVATTALHSVIEKRLWMPEQPTYLSKFGSRLCNTT